MNISELLGTIGKTEEQDKISYSAGVVMGLSLKDNGFDEISYEDFVDGLKSVYSNSYPKISQKRAIEIFNNYITLLREEMKEQNATEGLQFLTENGKRPEVVTLPSGVQYEVLVEGSGKSPQVTDDVRVLYEGYLLNKAVFDSTKDIGSFDINIGQTISGWQQVLPLMNEGARWKVYIPHQFAYGEEGAAPMIQPNATLVFIIELLQILE